MSKAIEMSLANQKDPVKELSMQEERRLEQLEGVVVETLSKAFVQIGEALAEIKERKLYRKKSMTFEKYCKELFDISKSRARELINAAGVIENLRSCGGFEDEQIILLPLNEAQARPLTKLRTEQQVAVWQSAVDSAQRGRVTASHVKKVVKEYLGEKIKTTVRRSQEKVAQESSTEFTESFEVFSLQILKERNSNYKYTSRGEIIKALDQLRADLAEDGVRIDEPAFQGGSDDANKLERAGFSLFRTDRQSMNIKQRNEKGAWVKQSGPYKTFKAMDAAFKELMQDDMYLRG